MLRISIYTLSLILFCNSLIAQSFTIQSNDIIVSGQPTDNDFYQNTYLDALTNTTISWSIVADSMPSAWETSNCFPNCYPVGVTSGTLNITNGQSYYLNGHFYPHNTSGEGFFTMEITDSITTELVTWHGIAGSVGIVNQFLTNKKQEIKNIFNLNGQIVNELKVNHFYIVQYKNNTTTKIFINE